MKLVSALVLGLLLIVPAGLCADDKKDTKDKKDDVLTKVQGTWEITKSEEESAIGSVVTFGKDGKLSISLQINGEEMKLEGKYKIEDGKLVTEVMIGDGSSSDTDSFKKLTADEMVLENKDGKVTELKRKKQ